MHAVRRLGFSLLVCVVLGAGCSSSDSGGASPSSTTLSGTAASGGAGQPRITVSAVRLVTNADSVLSFELRFTTSSPAVMTLHVDGPGGAWSVTPERSATTVHAIPVVDLRARSRIRPGSRRTTV